MLEDHPIEYYGALPNLPEYDYSALLDQVESPPVTDRLQTLVIRPHDSDPDVTVVHLGFGGLSLIIAYYQGDTVDYSFPAAIEDEA